MTMPAPERKPVNNNKTYMQNDPKQKTYMQNPPLQSMRLHTPVGSEQWKMSMQQMMQLPLLVLLSAVMLIMADILCIP